MNKSERIPSAPNNNEDELELTENDIEEVPELDPNDVELEEELPNLDDLSALSPEEAESKLEMKELSKFESAGASEASEKHSDRNEDAFFMDTENGTAGVFDGLGGYGGGDIASKIARENVEIEMSELPEDIKLEDLKQKMSEILKKASNKIVEESKTAKLEKIGTTASLVKFWNGPNGEKKAVIANVGDSRVYRLRNGKLELTTEDDSIMKRLMDNGVIKDDNPKQMIKGQDVINTGLLSKEDSEKLDPNMNIAIESIRRMMGQALGVNENNNTNLKPNIITIDVKKGDVLLLSTDGIHDNLTDEQIEKLLNKGGNEQKLVDSIVRQADLVIADTNNPRAKEDDKTAVIIRV